MLKCTLAWVARYASNFCCAQIAAPLQHLSTTSSPYKDQTKTVERIRPLPCSPFEDVTSCDLNAVAEGVSARQLTVHDDARRPERGSNLSTWAVMHRHDRPSLNP